MLSQESSVNSSQQPNASQIRRDREEKEEEASSVIDYSVLAKEHKREVADSHEYEAMNNSFMEKQKAIASQIDKMTPNLKANEHLSDVNKRLESLNEDLAKARDDSTGAAFQFNQTKKARRDRFMAAFDHLSKRIDQIYKDLTKSKKFPHGGQANLTLEETEEPYLAGIKYHAMPPNKRFRDMEQLSGGEKTLAALALLFAIHSYQPSPFFVLDEIDDALDQDNVVTVANYVKSRRDDLQSIVISLKETFYEKADALVGICKDMANWRTAVYTVDLTNYEE
jgi:structural maintenance of chromosome 1